MKNTNKKGFTIVELVIVIAVIAILAAVLIPTFVGLVNKANLSADKVAINTMNKYLASEECKTISDAIKLLDTKGLTIEDYKALTKDHYFYFVDGKIILADKDNKVVFPENAKAEGQWMSLSGMVPMSDDYTIENSAVTIDNGAELAHLMEAIKNDKTTVTTINLPAKIDLMGAAVDFGEVSESISLIGVEGGTELLGVRVSEETLSPTTGEFAGHNYGYGIFGDIETGATVTISNVTFKDLVVGNTAKTHEEGANTTGLIAGYVKGTLKMENVTIDNCVVNGYQKVSGIVGQLSGTLEMTNVNITNTTVTGHTEVAKIAGQVLSTGNLTVATDCDFAGVTVKSIAADQVKASDVTFTNNFALKGDENNTYFVGGVGGYEGQEWLWAGATNDWAWYSTGEGIDTRAEKYDVAVKGTQVDNFNGIIWSASKNFTVGQPVAE